MGNSIFMMG